MQQATGHGMFKLIHVFAGHNLVLEIIDFEQMEDSMMVAYGVCDQLDELKHMYHGLPDFLTKARPSSI